MRRTLAVVAVALVAATATACGINGQNPSSAWVETPDGGRVACVGTDSGGLDCDWANAQRKGR